MIRLILIKMANPLIGAKNCFLNHIMRGGFIPALLQLFSARSHKIYTMIGQYVGVEKEKSSETEDLLLLGIRDSNPNFHVQSVACCRCTNPQSDGYFTT